MKRIRKEITLIVCLCSLLLVSCERERVSYTDKYIEEKILIAVFIAEQGIQILTEYPKDGVFGEKEFVSLDNGVYLHVIDSGNGNRPVKGTKINTLAKGFVIGDADHNFDGFTKSTADTQAWPLTFTYGEKNYSDWNEYVGDGYMSVMDYVGNNSSVRMIVPFSVGSVYQNHHYCAMYFDKVNFTFTE